MKQQKSLYEIDILLIEYSKRNQRILDKQVFLKFTVICVDIRCPVTKATVPQSSIWTNADYGSARLVALIVLLAFAVPVVTI